MLVVKPEGGPAVSVKPGQKSCVRSGGIIALSAWRLVTVGDKAHLRRGHNDQSRRGHQFSEASLTGESRFHISIPLGIEPGSLTAGSKWVVHWTSETWCKCSEIAGSPHKPPKSAEANRVSLVVLTCKTLVINWYVASLWSAGYWYVFCSVIICWLIYDMSSDQLWALIMYVALTDPMWADMWQVQKSAVGWYVTSSVRTDSHKQYSFPPHRKLPEKKATVATETRRKSDLYEHSQ